MTAESSELSQSTALALSELKRQQAAYSPNKLTAKQLSQKTLIMLVGPSCIGKSVIMNKVVELDDRFAITGTFTTREKRDDDQGKHYTYIPHTDEGLASISSAVKEGSIVQYAVHPTSERIYGSVIADYPKDFDMLDTLSTAVEAIQTLPAKKTIVVGVTVGAVQWQEWFDARFPQGHPDRTKRIEEAIQSLTWLLKQPADGLAWVINTLGASEVPAKEVIAISLGESQGSFSGREVAEAVLEAAGNMQ